MANATPNILIFDSGVGGLSILREIHRKLPHCRLQFASDNAGFPYGTRTEADLIQRVSLVLDRLIQQLHPDIVVIACNSASTVVLPEIRSRYQIPIVGVVPAIKPAALQTQTGRIGLLATPATVKRPYTDLLIRDFASNCLVDRIGSSELVYQAERKMRGQPVDMALIEKIIAPFFNNDHAPMLDTIVLACTHFPLLLEELKAVAPTQVTWIDSGEAIARRVSSLLPPASANEIERSSLRHASWLTSPDNELDCIQQYLSQFGQFESGVLSV